MSEQWIKSSLRIAWDSKKIFRAVSPSTSEFGFLGTSREFLHLLDSLSTAAREGWAALEAAVATKEQTWFPEE